MTHSKTSSDFNDIILAMVEIHLVIVDEITQSSFQY